MTAGDAGNTRDVPVVPASPNEGPSLSYGNIYTPHAGSMIIHVQRESGLQSRMIVLGPRRVRLLRFLTSPGGKAALVAGCAIMIAIIAEAARVPSLVRRVARMEHTAARLDSLERSLGQLQQRYDQVRTMMGADSSVAAAGAARLAGRQPTSLPPAPPGAPLRVGTPVSPDPEGAVAGDARAPQSVAGGEGPNVPAAATAIAEPDQQMDAPVPAHPRRRRRATAVAPPAPADTTQTAPDSGAVPSAQAEPQ